MVVGVASQRNKLPVFKSKQTVPQLQEGNVFLDRAVVSTDSNIVVTKSRNSCL
jgi:hypothetical protein